MENNSQNEPKKAEEKKVDPAKLKKFNIWVEDMHPNQPGPHAAQRPPAEPQVHSVYDP